MTHATTTGTTGALTPDEIEDYRDRFAAHLAQTVPGRKEFVVAGASGCTVGSAFHGPSTARFASWISGPDRHRSPAGLMEMMRFARRHAHWRCRPRYESTR